MLSWTALVDPLTVALAGGALVALTRYRVHPAWLLAAGACLGWLAVMPFR
jgi:hypothetical protein